MNAVGERMLGYLRERKDLFEERGWQRSKGRLRPQLTLLVDRVLNMHKFWNVVSLLRENSRMSIVEMSRRPGDSGKHAVRHLKEVEKGLWFTIVLKEETKCSAKSILIEST
jgi:hypothetical protein